ncbi:MAG: hypothetical protein QHJ34_03275 [bacterium]|jgi:hypothetical protein|nr:hypothetical protein [candidate division KSB1 bacterium]MDH7559234.1 hypothetical protein [bacterium]
MRVKGLCCASLSFVLLACSHKDIEKPSPLQADVNIAIGSTPVGTIAPLLGVNIGPAPSVTGPATADLTRAYQEIGVTLVRTHDFYGPLDMALMYRDRTRDPSDPAAYDFAASDFMWRAIVDEGFEPYFRLGDSWNNATPPANAQERANWVGAAVEVVRHYREGKWNGFTTPFPYVEIWNEPDNAQFWPPPRTRLEFFQLFVDAAKALKEAFPDLQVGGPGMMQTGFMTAQGKEWVRSFLGYLKQNNTPLDFFSWHLYSNEPSDWLIGARSYHSELDAAGFPSATMHVTEWNTDIMFVEEKSAEAFALRTGGKGAAILTAAWIAMQQEGVAAATFYRGPDPAADAPTFYGMFYADGRPKRVARAFSLWALLTTYPQRLAVAATPASSLWMLAGLNEAGERALLIANPTAEAVSYAISGIGAGRLSLLQVDDASADVQHPLVNDTVLSIPGYAVQLVRIER